MRKRGNRLTAGLAVVAALIAGVTASWPAAVSEPMTLDEQTATWEKNWAARPAPGSR